MYNTDIQEDLRMAHNKQHDKQFKLDALKYVQEHPDLTQEECCKNLGIGLSTLARWKAQYAEHDGDIPTRGSGSYSSDEQKKNQRKEKIQKIYDASNQIYGAPKITRELQKAGETINKANARRDTDLPLILHSDRGSQYVSTAYREAAEKFQLSCSHKGYPYNNACIESFHALIKREWLNRFKIRDYTHAYSLVFEYIEAFYNTIRIHSHCGYMSPDQFERLFEKVKGAA